MGLQSSTEELMNTIPLRDTVAGEALSMLWGSNTTCVRDGFRHVSIKDFLKESITLGFWRSILTIIYLLNFFVYLFYIKLFNIDLIVT